MIEGKIAGATIVPQGENAGYARLFLEPIDKGCVGQSVVYITNPTSDLEMVKSWIGRVLWGGCNSVFIDNKKFAVRKGYIYLNLTEEFSEKE